MARTRRTRPGFGLATYFTDYNRQNDDTPADEDTLEIPEDLTTLSDEELGALHSRAVEAFGAIYQDGTAVLSADDVTTLETLTTGIEALAAEVTTRDTAAEARREAAAALAARAIPVPEDTSSADGEDPEGGDSDNPDAGDGETPAADAPAGDPAPTDDPDPATDTPNAVSASGARAPRQRITVSGLRRSAPAPARPFTPAARPSSISDVAFAAPDVSGFAAGAQLDWDGLGRAFDSRLQAVPHQAVRAAQRNGTPMRQRLATAMLRKSFASGAVLESDDQASIARVFDFAASERNTPKGSLVASGGWCAPSETLYNLFELESSDGMISVPEINMTRGGINFTPGPTFSSIYSDYVGFSYAEADDEAGDYDGDGGGAKPCVHVECPDFTEVRLGVEGLCITAGLLQRRGYPEVIARVIRGALIAHGHRVAAKTVDAMATGSTAVSLAANQVGSTAPILSAIEMQVEQYRYLHRMPQNATLEAVFPHWVFGPIRSDLSRRLGVDLLSVTNQQIQGWFAQRGVASQFVYDWTGQDLATTAATAMVAWPTSVKFLLYAAGTWVRGTNDVITLDTIYDSVNLGTNDYTALFTEEGFVMVKRGHDSRVVTVPINSNGSTGAGLELTNAGIKAA